MRYTHTIPFVFLFLSFALKTPGLKSNFDYRSRGELTNCMRHLKKEKERGALNKMKTKRSNKKEDASVSPLLFRGHRSCIIKLRTPLHLLLSLSLQGSSSSKQFYRLQEAKKQNEKERGIQDKKKE